MSSAIKTKIVSILSNNDYIWQTLYYGIQHNDLFDIYKLQCNCRCSYIRQFRIPMWNTLRCSLTYLMRETTFLVCEKLPRLLYHSTGEQNCCCDNIQISCMFNESIQTICWFSGMIRFQVKKESGVKGPKCLFTFFCLKDVSLWYPLKMQQNMAWDS